MTVKETLYAQRKRMNELRRARLDSGLCVICGNHPRGRNNDGTLSVKCTDCRASQTARKFRYASHSHRVQYSNTELSDIRDGIAFKAYSLAIRRLFDIHGELTTRMIHEALGFEKQHLTIDAIKWIGNVEESVTVPTRYKLAEPKPKPPPIDEVKRRDFRRWLTQQALSVPTHVLELGKTA